MRDSHGEASLCIDSVGIFINKVIIGRKHIQTLSLWQKDHTNFSAVPGALHATGCSECSANLDNCELPGLVSALRGRNEVSDVWFDVNAPEADDGLEFGPHALEEGSCAFSLPAVDGRVPLPDERWPLRWLGEVPPSAFGDSDGEPHAFDAEDDLLPQPRVPLQVLN